MIGHRRWIAVALLAAATCGSPAAAEEPKPKEAKPAPAKEPQEPVLEGEAKKRYEEELWKHLQVLRKEKNGEVVRLYVAQLGTQFSRAGRDALIQYARGNKNQEAVGYAFDALAKLVDAKATFFLCGKDGVRSGDFLVQHSAVRALGVAKNPKAVDPMLEVMKDPAVKIEIQGAVCLALAKTAPADPRVVEQVFRCADDRRDTVRANAIEALGYLSSKEAFNRLLDSLANDKNTRVRGAAATGLGWTGRREAIPDLEEAIANDKSLTVRSAASEAIAKIRGGK